MGDAGGQRDDALRAIRAAEDMRRALAVLNDDLEERWGVRIGLRTAVNTGEVVVDPAKSADLLVGDALNVAARLEQAAAPGRCSSAARPTASSATTPASSRSPRRSS